jgi:AcrR family transcriptional regulator
MTRRETATGRREKALVTRRRMLKAACESFCDRGYAGTTMEVIAERAGVAVQTLYFTFHTKAAVLQETLGAAILGFEHWDPRISSAIEADSRKAFADFHPWFGDFERAKSRLDALSVFVDASVEIFGRVARLVPVIAQAAAGDAQVKATRDLGEQRRVDGYQFVIEMLAKRGKLRRGRSVRRATDILLVLLSAETYLALTEGRGWSQNECKKWFLKLLSRELFE